MERPQPSLANQHVSPYFKDNAEIRRTANRLPHWEQSGVLCFVTFRLTDSLPESLLSRWKDERRTWLKLHPKPWDAKIEAAYHQRFRRQVELALDAGHGSCLLRDPTCADIVGRALLHFDKDRYDQIAWVVMPNHVHTVFVLHSKWPLARLIHSWKSWSSKQMKLRLGNHSGAIWQKDYFDRLIRDSNHLFQVVDYIRSNPARAKLPATTYLTWESQTAREMK
jgi:hypothetical protein